MQLPRCDTKVRRRREWLLEALAIRANNCHRCARNFACSSIYQAKMAGDALARARDLVDDGGWGRWLTGNFKGSKRTAQRYIKLARNWDELLSDPKRAPPRSQREAVKALKRMVLEVTGLDDARPRPPREPEGLFDDPLHWRPIPARAAEGGPRVIDLAAPRLTELARFLVSKYAPSDHYGGAVIEAILDLREDPWRRRPREECA